MRMHTHAAGGLERPRADVPALLAALLLFAAVLAFVGCGGDDLIFPGNAPATPTQQNTVTPTP